MYAIRNKRTGKWLYGTDFRHYPYTQRTSFEQAMTWEMYEAAFSEFKSRMCGKDYEIIPVRIEEIEIGGGQ